MSRGEGCGSSSAECCIFNRPHNLSASGIRFGGDSLLCPPEDNYIIKLPSRPSPAPETSHDAPDNATSKASESSPSCGALASLAGLGFSLGSGRLASGSNEPPRNWARAIASFA